MSRTPQSGELRSDLNPETTAETIWLVHDGLVRELYVSPSGHWEAGGRPLVDTTIEVLLAGLRNHKLPRGSRRRRI